MNYTRALGLVAGVVLAAGSLTACADRPGVAATVGQVSISESQLQQEAAEVTARAAQAQPQTPISGPEAARRILTAKIRHVLAQNAATSAGVEVTDATVNAAIASATPEAVANQLGVPIADVPQAVRDVLTLQNLAQQHTGGVPSTEAQVTFQKADSAEEAAVLRAKFQHDPAAMTGEQTTVSSLIGATSLVPTGLFTAPVGSVMVLQEQSTYVVVRIDTRSVVDNVDIAKALSSVKAGQIEVATLMLAKDGLELGVSVNPRFGIWDPSTLQVVADPTAA